MAKPVQHYGQWRIRWKDADGKRHSEVFEKYQEAEFALRKHQHEAEEVRRGFRMRIEQGRTFNEICNYWLANRAPRKRSGNHDESIIRCHLRPAFGSLALNQLGIQQVDQFLTSRRHLDIKTVHNHLTLLISMLNVAKDLGWIAHLPRIRKPRISIMSEAYRFLKTEDEIQRFLSAAKEQGDHAYYLYATAIYTGMRQGELAALEWGDVNFSGRLITVRRSFDGPTKSGEVRYVPLLDVLLPLFLEWKNHSCTTHVFPNGRGRMYSKSARVFQEEFRMVLDRAGFPRNARRGRGQSYIVFHDLRHTFASHWMMKNGELFKLQKILGHKSPQMTMRYAHLSPTAFEGDLGRLGSGKAIARVIPIRTSSAG